MASFMFWPAWFKDPMAPARRTASFAVKPLLVMAARIPSAVGAEKSQEDIPLLELLLPSARPS
eukprot:768664-Hanusia_phi.AAC.6